MKNGKKLYNERAITFFHETERYANDLNIYNRSKNGTNLRDDLIVWIARDNITGRFNRYWQKRSSFLTFLSITKKLTYKIPRNNGCFLILGQLRGSNGWHITFIATYISYYAYRYSHLRCFLIRNRTFDTIPLRLPSRMTYRICLVLSSAPNNFQYRRFTVYKIHKRKKLVDARTTAVLLACVRWRVCTLKQT